jgi:hypothetical protein
MVLDGTSRAQSAEAAFTGDPTSQVTNPTLLLSPPSSGGDATGASLMHLYLLLVAHQATETNEKQSELAVQEHLEDVAIHRQEQARIDEANADRSNGGFFDSIGSFLRQAASDAVEGRLGDVEQAFDKDIASNPQFWRDLERGAQEIGRWAAVAGSIALAGITVGAGAGVAGFVIAGAALSTVGAVQSEFNVVSGQAAGWVAFGLSIAGTVCSASGGLLATGNTIAETAVNHGFRVAGVVADAGAGASSVVGGGAQIEVARFEESATLARVDQKRAGFAAERIDRRVQDALDALQEYQESASSDLATVRKIQQAHSRTQIGLASMRA